MNDSGGLKPLSDKGKFLTESVIREMTRLANLHGAINLAQGMPDFETPAELKQAAEDAATPLGKGYRRKFAARSGNKRGGVRGRFAEGCHNHATVNAGHE